MKCLWLKNGRVKTMMKLKLAKVCEGEYEQEKKYRTINGGGVVSGTEPASIAFGRIFGSR